jgi:hypothetical protein
MTKAKSTPKSATKKSAANKSTQITTPNAPQQALESIKGNEGVLRKFLPVLILVALVLVLIGVLASGPQSRKVVTAPLTPSPASKTVLAKVTSTPSNDEDTNFTGNAPVDNNSSVTATTASTSKPVATLKPTPSSSNPTILSPQDSPESNNPVTVVQPPSETHTGNTSEPSRPESANPIAGTIDHVIHQTLLNLGINIHVIN